jgi:histidyl-tRNA synthetase
MKLTTKKENMSTKIQTLKGFRDILPTEKRQRDLVAKKISRIFETYGFAPLETPTLEYSELLLGKYGTEADKLVYTFSDKGGRDVGLRYDQTVPTSRVLAQYQSELPRYFRRYQIQNVFRADKPQRGRFREFTQCDCDIFGSTSPLADAEILAVFYAVFKGLGFSNIKLKINDRQTLVSTLSPFATTTTSIASIIQSIDKLDKLSIEKVTAELVSKGLTKAAAEAVLAELKNSFMSDNLKEIVDTATKLGVATDALEFDPKLARGLDYYTGLIFEGSLSEYTVGSVGGGGRYDNLIGDLSGSDIPAVGFGIGFDRTVEAALQLGLVEQDIIGTQILVTTFSEDFLANSLQVTNQLRQAGIRTELYPALDKLSKQFKLADQKNIPFVIIIGETEVAENQVTLKNMKSGEQTLLSLEEVIRLVTQ